ncbi:MAG: endonuclease/exonuclease/phosphatase family protein [Phycisphaeraceae bacterium]|nr:endonuclease/exonuclease/phosphatase family protein [Phycisphaeraceae bacterium]
MSTDSLAPDVRRMRRTRLSAVMIVLAWIAVLAALLYRPTFREEGPMLILGWALFMLRTFLSVAGVGALAIAVAMLATRRRRLAVACALLAGVCAAPAVSILRTQGEAEPIEQPLRVMSFNVLAINRNHDAVAREIVRQDPDVLLILECTPRWESELCERLGDSYPHRQTIWWNDRFGMMLLSRRRFDSTRVLGRFGRPCVRAEIGSGNGAIVLYGVHYPHPVTPKRVHAAWQMFADTLELAADETLPVVIMGDCNFGSTSPQTPALARAGFRDAQAICGQGLGMTWSARGPFSLLPGARIDHIFIGQGLACSGAWTGRASGSDHRPVIADIGRTRAPLRSAGD